MTILVSFDMFIVRIEFDSAMHSTYFLLYRLGVGLDAPELNNQAGTFVFQVKSLYFLQNLSCVLCEHLEKPIFYWLELLKETISIDMDLSTKTNALKLLKLKFSEKQLLFLD